MSDMTCEEEPEICLLKTREMLAIAEVLLRDIKELLDLFASTDLPLQRVSECRTIQQECYASIEEDGETLVIEGFRFESEASREDLKRICPQAGAEGNSNA